MTAQALPNSVEAMLTLLSSHGYLAERALATVTYLSLRMGRPLFLEGEAEDHHHQQREEQHGVDGVLGAPLHAQIFHQRCAGDAERAHRAVLSAAFAAASRTTSARETICPSAMWTSSSATPSISAAWCVTTKIVLP